MIYAIDPGTEKSGVCMIGEDYAPIYFFKASNEIALKNLHHVAAQAHDDGMIVLIERVASYGKRIGNEVLQTAEWYGRFYELAENMHIPVRNLYRREVKMELLRNVTKTDADIKREMIRRFARYDFKTGKGTKKEPDFFYGFKEDIWQAFALGVAFLDMEKRNERIGRLKKKERSRSQ